MYYRLAELLLRVSLFMGNRPMNTDHLGLLLDCDPKLALTGLPQLLTSPVLPTALLINDENILHIKHSSKYLCANIYNSQKPCKGGISLHLTGESREIQ